MYLCLFFIHSYLDRLYIKMDEASESPACVQELSQIILDTGAAIL